MASGSDSHTVVAGDPAHEPLGRDLGLVVLEAAAARAPPGPPLGPRDRRLVGDHRGDQLGSTVGGGEGDRAAEAVAGDDRRATGAVTDQLEQREQVGDVVVELGGRVG